VAKWIRQKISNLSIAGSNPAGCTTYETKTKQRSRTMKNKIKKTPRCILPPNKAIKNKKKTKNKNKCREKIKPWS
jgi:hypothetical protein